MIWCSSNCKLKDSSAFPSLLLGFFPPLLWPTVILYVEYYRTLSVESRLLHSEIFQYFRDVTDVILSVAKAL